MLKLRTDQEFGKNKIRPQQVNLELYKSVTLGDTPEEDEVNESGFSYENLNVFLHTERVNQNAAGGNVEN